MRISRCVLSFLILFFATSINAMQQGDYRVIDTKVVASCFIPNLDAWYYNEFITSGHEGQKKMAFHAARHERFKLYYLLNKHPELAKKQSGNGENLLSALLQCRHHVTSAQAKFLLGCPFNLDPNIGANDSIFYRVITLFQKKFMKELLQHANFKITQQHLDTINWIIGNNPHIPEDTMQWWLSIKNNLKSRLIIAKK